MFSDLCYYTPVGAENARILLTRADVPGRKGAWFMWLEPDGSILIHATRNRGGAIRACPPRFRIHPVWALPLEQLLRRGRVRMKAMKVRPAEAKDRVKPLDMATLIRATARSKGGPLDDEDH